MRRLDSEAILDDIADGLVVVDTDSWEIRDANRTVRSMLGYASEELLDEPVDRMLADGAVDASDMLANRIHRTRDDGSSQFDWLLEGPDGEAIPVGVSLSVTDRAGEELALLSVREASNPAETEYDIEGLETTLQLALEETNTGVWEWDLQTDDVVWDEQQERLFGYEPGEFDGRYEQFADRVHPDDIDDVEAAHERGIEEGFYQAEYRIYVGGETKRWVDARAKVLYEDGESRRMVGITTDITDLKEREQELEELSTRLQLALEGTNTGVWEWDIENDQQVWDEQAQRLYGYEPGETEQSYEAFADSVHPDDLAEMEAIHEQRLAEGFPDDYGFDFRIVDDGDVQRWVSTQMKVYAEDGEPKRMLGIVTDITERKEREQELRELKNFNEELVENAPVGLFRLDEDLRIVYENPRAEEIVGVPKEQTESQSIGRDIREVPSLVEAGVAEKFDHVAEGETISLDFEFTSIYGRETHLEGQCVPLLKDGTVDGALLLLHDVTERKEYERRLETQRDNLDVLNQVLRHDIRNDLQLIHAHAELLAEASENDLDDHVETILETSNHAVELTTAARDMADAMRSEDEELSAVSLESVVERELDEVRSTYPMASVTLETTVPPVSVRANDMLDSVFRNLLQNAIQHSDKKIPEVAVSVTEREETVSIRVADNGPGIPDHRKERVFGKSETGLDSNGTGIGLFLVQSLVESYDGDVWVEANDPEGAVFVVTLPIAD